MVNEEVHCVRARCLKRSPYRRVCAGLRTLPSAHDDRPGPTLLPREAFVSFADKILTCRDCGEPFTFTQGDRESFAQKGFTNEPGRCPECRSARKSERRGGG